MNTYTFDFLTESQDFDLNETFVLESDMIQECSHRQKQIERLKQQLEVYKESSKLLSDTLESRENDILYLRKSIFSLRHPDTQLGSCICSQCISIDKFLAKYHSVNANKMVAKVLEGEK